MSAVSGVAAPPFDSDTLLHPGPTVAFTDLGWSEACPSTRARAIVWEGVQRIEGAANALYGQCHNTEPSRASALLFIAATLMAQAKLMKRALAVQRQVEEDASDARSAAASRAALARNRRAGPAAEGGGV